MYSVKILLEIIFYPYMVYWNLIVIWNLFDCNYLVVLRTSKISERIILL